MSAFVSSSSFLPTNNIRTSKCPVHSVAPVCPVVSPSRLPNTSAPSMVLTFPGNAKRIDRVVELGTDAQDFLQEATADFEEFQSLVAIANKQIASVYQAAGLQAPGIRSIDIFREAGVADTADADAIVAVSDVIVDIAGLVSEVKYLAPAATRFLTKTGILSAETAEKVLITIPERFFGRELEVDAGDIAGNVLGGIVGGIAIAGIDIAIDAIEGTILKKKLQNAIHDLYNERTTLQVSRLKSRKLTNFLRAIKTTLDALEGTGIQITDQVMRNLIRKDADPSLIRADNITAETVATDFRSFDKMRNSYTSDDPSI